MFGSDALRTLFCSMQKTFVYNSATSFLCSGRFVQFDFFAPYNSLSNENTLSLVSFKAISLRVIQNKKRFVKNSDWFFCDLTIPETIKLVHHNFDKGPFSIKTSKKQISVISIISKTFNNRPQPKLWFKMQNDKSSTDFYLLKKDFNLVTKLFESGVKDIYGLTNSYQQSLQILLKNIEEDNIQIIDEEMQPAESKEDNKDLKEDLKNFKLF